MRNHAVPGSVRHMIVPRGAAHRCRRERQVAIEYRVLVFVVRNVAQRRCGMQARRPGRRRRRSWRAASPARPSHEPPRDGAKLRDARVPHLRLHDSDARRGPGAIPLRRRCAIPRRRRWGRAMRSRPWRAPRCPPARTALRRIVAGRRPARSISASASLASCRQCRSTISSTSGPSASRNACISSTTPSRAIGAAYLMARNPGARIRRASATRCEHRRARQSRHVGGNGARCRAAEPLAQRHAFEARSKIPQRDVDGRERIDVVAAGSAAHALQVVEILPDDRCIARHRGRRRTVRAGRR